MKRASLFKTWSFKAMGHRHGNQKVARLLQPEGRELTLDKMWGLVPTYTGKVIRRRPAMA